MNTWTVDDFLTYLYHIVADADLHTADSEVETIKKGVSRILSTHFGNDHYSYEASLEKIQNTEGVSILKSNEVIKKLIPKFEFSKDVKKAIAADLDAIASADNKVTASEKETLSLIKETLLAVEMPLSW